MMGAGHILRGGEEIDRVLAIEHVGGPGIAKDKYGRLTVHEK